MDLIQTFEAGKFPGYPLPEKIVETLLSKIFFFPGKKVIKIYKHAKAFYGDLTAFDFRKKFFNEDFLWNRIMAPEIYLRLGGTKKINSDEFAECPIEEAEDFFIEMAEIDSSRNLTRMLLKNKVTPDLMTKMAELMSARLDDLTARTKETLADLFEIGYPLLYEIEIEDLQDWLKMVSQIPADEIKIVMEWLYRQIKTAEFIEYCENSCKLVSTIDNNCDNLLFLPSGPSFIDIMPPKYNWRVSDKFFNMSRTAVDAKVLGSDELSEAFYSCFDSQAPRIVRKIYEIHSAAIQWAYRYTINQPANALKYREFISKKIKAC